MQSRPDCSNSQTGRCVRRCQDNNGNINFCQQQPQELVLQVVLPQPLLPPHRQLINRIQISHSQQSLPLPPPLPPKRPLPQPPLPPQNNSRRIQMQLLPPNNPPLLSYPHPQELLLQPQLVAVKSLILVPP